MPGLFIEASEFALKRRVKMVQKLTEAIDEAYHIGGTLIFLRGVFDGKCSHGRKAAIGKSQIQEALKKISAGA